MLFTVFPATDKMIEGEGDKDRKRKKERERGEFASGARSPSQ